ncbi:SPX domain-containing protein [Lentinula boryana]|uniref:SPX domain-containing protein n=1 Tax=Lentinula boryana TaxID=40481 RepID=A0ABQ8Q6Z0_9AGAR|nr:SPX domain-containing protein [Lentinula boryana]
MHFSKTYTQLLLDLPPELRENAIQYRQLKKLINQVVLELSALGLHPDVLQKLLEDEKRADAKGNQKETSRNASLESTNDPGIHPKVVYEFNSKSGKIEPQLRIWINSPLSPASSDVPHDAEVNLDTGELETPEEHSEDTARRNISLLWALQRNSAIQDWEEDSPQITEVADSSNTTEEQLLSVKHPILALDNQGTPQEVVIPLVKDSAFFELLSTALHNLSDRMSALYTDFTDTLETVSRNISDSARPISSRKNTFHPHSVLSNPGTVSITSKTNKSDLYSWREIFQLYVESEVFESSNEANPGELSIEQSEKRLKLFAERVTLRGLGDKRKLKLKQSHEALESFLQLNMFILNVKKLEQANAEATRKILKKHAKRTALPLPPGQDYYAQELALIPRSKTNTSLNTLPRVLVQALGETLLPIIPHVDDYSCIICTNLAFKPIRLGCGHLFCVRCLVKMQKRGQGDCPMCRAPTVLRADQSNVDWGLMNFMEDWFSEEAHEKLKASEREATEEHFREMGFDPDQKCIVM